MAESAPDTSWAKEEGHDEENAALTSSDGEGGAPGAGGDHGTSAGIGSAGADGSGGSWSDPQVPQVTSGKSGVQPQRQEELCPPILSFRQIHHRRIKPHAIYRAVCCHLLRPSLAGTDRFEVVRDGFLLHHHYERDGMDQTGHR